MSQGAARQFPGLDVKSDPRPACHPRAFPIPRPHHPDAPTRQAVPRPGAARTGEMAMTLSRNDRRGFIGGSDARIIMGEDEAALVQLWREKRGEAAPQDLADNLIVQLGAATEELNRRWYQRNTGNAIT